ncbi:MAG TPA: hypothetical protein VK936_12810 [Longimicrobiales bacterium]|nr:hypothetical protein [Longimicrobiales bacterium]
MYVLRCTGALLRDVARYHLPAGDAGSATRLGDWYATRLNAGPRRYVLATSSLCLLSVVVPARDLRSLPLRLVAAVDRLLAHIGVPDAARRDELAAMAEARVAKTNSRSVLGSMAFLAEQAGEQLHDLPHRPGRTLGHVDAWLAEVSCGVLELRTPAEAALDLLRGPARAAGRRR